MEETALNESVQMDLPAPKPTRKRRRPRRLAAFALAGSALFAAYWFTRPPALVWWKSPALMATQRSLRLQLPGGWRFEPTQSGNAQRFSLFVFMPVDRRPRLLKWLLPAHEEPALLTVLVSPSLVHSTSTRGFGRNPPRFSVTRYKSVHGFYVEAKYYRTNQKEFNRTYKQICNSLRIE